MFFRCIFINSTGICCLLLTGWTWLVEVSPYVVVAYIWRLQWQAKSVNMLERRWSSHRAIRSTFHDQSLHYSLVIAELFSIDVRINCCQWSRFLQFLNCADELKWTFGSVIEFGGVNDRIGVSSRSNSVSKSLSVLSVWEISYRPLWTFKPKKLPKTFMSLRRLVFS